MFCGSTGSSWESSWEDSELHAMVRESCSRLQLPQPHNFQIPRRFDVRTELNFDEKPKRMATEKTWISRMEYRQGRQDWNYKKKRLNTIKPVNSLYIRFREFNLPVFSPTKRSGKKALLNIWHLKVANINIVSRDMMLSEVGAGIHVGVRCMYEIELEWRHVWVGM